MRYFLAILLIIFAIRTVLAENVSITVQSGSGTAYVTKADANSARVEYDAAYKPDDAIVITSTAKYLFVQVDAAVPRSLIYIPGGKLTFPIPEGAELEMGYDPAAFAGGTHLIEARVAMPEEITARRNVALNAADKRGQAEYFPHASANAVTRNEQDFYERNAIDGNVNNAHHGPWPFESWSGGAREDLTYKVDFGREVEIDAVRFFLRCDFPHDTYWKSLRVNFADGSHLDVALDKKRDAQEFSFPPKKVTWLQLDGFKQAATPLTWAGLTELEVMGHDAAARP